MGFAKSAKFGSLCAFQAAFHEHLKTAAFVDAVGLGLSNLVPKCQEADGNQEADVQLPSFETFVKSLEKWHFEADFSCLELGRLKS